MQQSSLPSAPSSTGTSVTGWVDADGTAHELCKFLIYVEKDFLGEFQFDPGGHPELRYTRSGVAYFCASCGDVWARLVLVDSTGKTKGFDAVHVSCGRHYDQWNVPGSLLAGRLDSLLSALPVKALVREFQIHMKYYGG